MAVYRHILVVVDLTDDSAAVAGRAQQLATRLGG